MKKDAQLYVMMGPGGVGKTTCSIALAMAGVRRGYKVGLLSVDPARRLAKALKIPLDASLAPVEAQGPGQLYAAMIDQKAIFDYLVSTYAPKKKQKKIFEHPFYVSASQQIAGPFEAMALVQLAKMQNEFDWIVLDTPPDAQALEFLERPKLMARFMGAGVMKWVLSSFKIGQKLGIERLAKVGERFFQGVGDVTGVRALLQVAEFLLLMQDVVQSVAEGSQVADEMLSSENAHYFAVMSPKEGPLRVVKTLQVSLQELGQELEGVFVNRCLPFEGDGSQSLPADLRKRYEMEKDIRESLLLPNVSLLDQWGGIGDLDGLSRLVDQLEPSLGQMCPL